MAKIARIRVVAACAVLVAVLGAGAAAQAELIGLAHRGGRVDAPENTLATFAHTMTVGLQWLETDSWLSSDGVLVLHHDVDLCRTTNIESFGYDCVDPLNNPLGRFPRVKDFTLAELKQLDAGSWFDPAFAGEQLPTLEEALLLVGGTEFVLVVEIKTNSQATKIGQILQTTGVSPDNLIAWTRQTGVNPEFRNDLPQVRRIVGGYDVSVTDTELDELAANGDFGIGLRTDNITEELVERAQARGLFVYGYPGPTGNLPLLGQIAIGVDGINYIDPQWFANTKANLPCVDGIDNDGDGFVDFDGLDADFDGQLEFGPDLNCDDRLYDSELAECQDGIDNDSDGLFDLADPGCWDAAWDREDAQCQDGINNDPGSDPDPGLIDFDGGQSIHGACADGVCPAGVSDPDGDGIANPDPHCVGQPWKNTETGGGCGLGFELALLLPALMWLRHRTREGR